MAKPRKRSVKQLKKLAWKEFSEFIRKRGADFYGINSCISCDGKYHWKEMNAGHWKHGRLDFDEMNVNCQCVRCNKWLSGKLDSYTIKLIELHGVEAVQALSDKAKSIVTEKYSRQELEDIYIKYKRLNQAQ